jgi:hypothetical protein
MGNAPIPHHDDHCALQGGNYFLEGEIVPGENDPAPAAAIEVHDARAVGATNADLPVIPANTEMTALAQMATTLAFADAVPKALRRKPNDVFLVLLTARDTGVALTTAMREFHVIEGTVTLSPKVKLAMVRQAGIGRIWPAPANDATGATWYAVRNDQPDHTVESTFTWEDAQLAGLVDSRCEPKRHFRNGNQSCMCKDNWKRYPQRMVSWRASGYLLDDVFPEVATGLYSPDELGAVTNADGEPIEVSATEGLPGMKGPRQTGQPEVVPASDEDRAEIHSRIAALSPAGRQALGAWWSSEELPKVDELAARQVAKIRARLTWQEQQPGSMADEETPEEPEDGPEAPEPTEQPAEPQTSPQGSEEAEELQVSDGQLVAWAIAAAQERPLAACKADFRAAGMQPPAGNEDVVRRAWCEWTLVQSITAAFGWVSLILTGWNLVDPDDVAEAWAEAAAGA